MTTTFARRGTRIVLTHLALLGLSGASALAQSASQPIVLDTVVIEGAGGQGEGGDGYVVRGSRAGTKTATPIIETPRSIDVIGRKELEDRAATTVTEAVRYSAGVTTNSVGFDPRYDQIYLRGFLVNTWGDFKDGLRQTQGQSAIFTTDPYTLDRIDIIKGPVAALYGQSAPGGIVDRISKRPFDGTRHEIIGTIADTGRYEVGFDVNQPVAGDGTVLARLIGLGRIGEVAFDNQDDRLLLAPSLTWSPDGDTSLTLYALAQRDETDSNPAVLNRTVNGRTVVFDIRASDPEYDFQKQEQYQGGYELEHRFAERFVFRSHTRYGNLDQSARYLTGDARFGGGWVGGIYRRSSAAQREWLSTVQSDNSLETRFSTGALEHTLLTGIDYQWSRSKYALGTLRRNPAYDLDPTDVSYGIDGPTPPLTSRNDVGLNQTGIYAQDQIAVGNWRLSGGARYDEATRSNENGLTGALLAERTDSKPTWNAGALYAFDNGVSPYASYSTSFLPAVSRDEKGNLLEPSEAEQFEIGVKWQPTGFDALFTAAYYDVTEQNGAKYVLSCFCFQSVGEVQGQGVELTGRLGLAEGLSATAAYTYNDMEITDDSVAVNIGKRPSSIPEHSGSLWLDYAFAQSSPVAGLQLGAGVRYVGSTFANNANTLRNDAYTLLDASLRYDLGQTIEDLEGYSLAVNATNLADERVTVCDASRCYLGEGRKVIGTLRYTW